VKAALSFFLFNFLIFHSLPPVCGNSSGSTAVPAVARRAAAPSSCTRHIGKPLEDDIKKRFEAAHSDYKVEFLDMGGGKILTRLQGEKERPQATSGGAVRLGDFKRAETQGLLEAYTPEWSNNLPADAKSATGGWVRDLSERRN